MQTAAAARTVALPQRKALRGKALVAAAPRRAAPKAKAVATTAGFIGSPTNLAMVASITAFLAAGRFGVMPTANAGAITNSYFKLNKKNSGLLSGDPSGFTWVDTIAAGALGHVAGVGIVLGLHLTA